VYPNQSLTSTVVVERSRGTGQLDLLQTDVVAALSILVQNQSNDKASAHFSVTLTGDDNLPADMISSFLGSRNRYRIAFLRNHFPTIPLDSLQRIFPLSDPLDLDLVVAWSVPSAESSPPRRGFAFLHGVRLAPEFSVVEDLRSQVQAAVANGGKQTRTMYEETGRLRRLLMDSVFDGVLAKEEDPVEVRVRVNGAKRGMVRHEFAKG
jgi:hypothetical protein